MAFAVTLWVTEAVPFAVTSLLVVLLIPAFGIADYRVVVRSGFGDPVITFFIGVLILSAAFTRSGLGTRLVYHVLLRVGTRTDRVLLGFLIVGVLISMWITKMAVAAMLLPIGLGDPARRRRQAAAEQLRPDDHDRRRVRAAHRRHRHARRARPPISSPSHSSNNSRTRMCRSRDGCSTACRPAS